MRYLVISTLPKEEEQIQKIIEELRGRGKEVEVLYSEDYEIKGCIGCNYCWLKTPGVCSIKDDYEKILIKYLQVDRVLFLTETKLGFISYKMKNMLDRILPLLKMYLRFVDGQMRHYTRYHKKFQMGVLYIGEADKEYLNAYMDRVMLNMGSTSLGAYPIEDRKELYHALDNH